jgi:hypothetical protein
MREAIRMTATTGHLKYVSQLHENAGVTYLQSACSIHLFQGESAIGKFSTEVLRLKSWYVTLDMTPVNNLSI